MVTTPVTGEGAGAGGAGSIPVEARLAKDHEQKTALTLAEGIFARPEAPEVTH